MGPKAKRHRKLIVEQVNKEKECESLKILEFFYLNIVPVELEES